MKVHDKAIRLLEGGVVQIEGNWFRLRQFPEYFNDIPCWECDLDSICKREHMEVCSVCEAISLRRSCLQLVTTKK